MIIVSRKRKNPELTEALTLILSAGNPSVLSDKTDRGDSKTLDRVQEFVLAIIYLPRPGVRIVHSQKKKPEMILRLFLWCYAVDILLTKSIELVDDYALRELVQEFSLSPDLVTA